MSEQQPQYGSTQYLLQLPQKIKEAEYLVLRLGLQVAAAKDVLKKREAELLTGEDPVIKIDGKNAETRAAQVTAATEVERKTVSDTEEVHQNARIEVAYLYNQLRAYEALASLRKPLQAAS